MSEGSGFPARLVFFGTAAFAVPSLEHLAADCRFDVAAVVTQPDRPSGRGRSSTPSAVKTAAHRLRIDVLQPERIRTESFRKALHALNPTFFVVAAYGRILPPALLSVPCLGPINVHGSLLPEYRGAAPIQRALMDGRTVTGVTTMLMAPELDAGDMLLQATYHVRPDDNAETVTVALAQLGADLIVSTLRGLLNSALQPVPQDHGRATYAPPITPADALLDWSKEAPAIVNQVRGLSPRPGVVTEYGGRFLKVIGASLWHETADAPPGVVLSLAREGVVVAAGSGSVLIRDVVPEGKRPMTAAEWARGARVTTGSVFASTPNLGNATAPRSATA